MKWSLFHTHTQQGDLTHQILDNQESTLLTEEAHVIHVKEKCGKNLLGRRESVNFKGGTRLILWKGQEEDIEKKEGNRDGN